MNRAPNLANAKIVIDNEVYRIEDLTILDSNKNILAIISTTYLHPDQETRGHSHKDQGEFYEFLSGKGTMTLGMNPPRNYPVTTGNVIYVDKTLWHQVQNKSDSIDLIFRCFIQGPNTRPQLVGPNAAIAPNPYSL